MERKMKSELDIVLEKLEIEVIQQLDDGSHYEKLKRSLELQLIKYMNKYIKKDFDMELVFHSIKKTLKNQMEITEKQFESVIKFIERERPFIGESRNRIYNYFSPVITKKKDRVTINSLEQFMN